MNDQPSVNAENLPLEVREHLMRGQHDQAIELLEEIYGISKDEANQVIEDYRASLRERKIALDIQIMNEQNQQENEAQKQFIYLWGSRLIIIILVMILMYLVIKVGTR